MTCPHDKETAHCSYCALLAKNARSTFLERKREATKADLLLKFEDGDYHGAQDCASDLRDIESELKGLRA